MITGDQYKSQYHDSAGFLCWDRVKFYNLEDSILESNEINSQNQILMLVTFRFDKFRLVFTDSNAFIRRSRIKCQFL